MKKKFNLLAIYSFIIALSIYVFTFFLYHHLGPDGTFVSEYYENPTKPFITLLFGVLGVTFHFAGIMSLLIGKIFFPKNETK